MVHAGKPHPDADQLTSLFRMLSDRTRLTILLLLAAGERNVSSLCESLRLPQPTVSHHLGLLRTSALICNRRDGKQIFYSLNGRVRLDGDRDLLIKVGELTVKIESLA